MPDWPRLSQQLFSGTPRAAVVPRLGGENDDPVQPHYAVEGTEFYPEGAEVYDFHESDNPHSTDPVITDPAVFAERADFGVVGRAVVLPGYVGGFPLIVGPHVLDTIQVATAGNILVYDGAQQNNGGVPVLSLVPSNGYIGISFPKGLMFMNGIFIVTSQAAQGCFVIERRLVKPLPAGTF